MTNKTNANRLIPKDADEKRHMMSNFLASSGLDGYEAKGSLSRKLIELIARNEGSDDELKEKLLSAFEEIGK